MHAKAEAGHADQQREKHTDHREDLVLSLVLCRRAKDGHRICGMSARERELLGCDVVDIRILLYRLETFDLRRVKIRSAAEADVFDHRVEHNADQQVEAHKAAKTLVIAPIQKTEDRHAGQFLPEGGEKRSKGRPKASHTRLQPEDQGNLPIVEKRMADQFHRLVLLNIMILFFYVLTNSV